MVVISNTMFLYGKEKKEKNNRTLVFSWVDAVLKPWFMCTVEGKGTLVFVCCYSMCNSFIQVHFRYAKWFSLPDIHSKAFGTCLFSETENIYSSL